MHFGGRQFIAGEFEDFLNRFGVKHHQSSAYTPHSNLRAESAVKSVKKIVSENCSVNGDLDTDGFTLALLQYCNTPCRYLEQSPAQILFARNLRDGVPQNPQQLILRPEWIQTKEAREKALSKKHIVATELWSRGTRGKMIYW